MDKLKIEEMKKEDVPELYNVLNRKYVEKYCEKDCEKKEQRVAHERWYNFILNSPFFVMYIIRNNENELVGTVKFEIHSERAIINVFFIEAIRGKGYSYKVINDCSDRLLKRYPIEIIEAYIIKENELSEKILKKLGYEFKKNANYNGMRHMLYVKKLPEHQYRIYFD